MMKNYKIRVGYDLEKQSCSNDARMLLKRSVYVYFGCVCVCVYHIISVGGEYIRLLVSAS